MWLNEFKQQILEINEHHQLYECDKAWETILVWKWIIHEFGLWLETVMLMVRFKFQFYPYQLSNNAEFQGESVSFCESHTKG